MGNLYLLFDYRPSVGLGHTRRCIELGKYLSLKLRLNPLIVEHPEFNNAPNLNFEFHKLDLHNDYQQDYIVVDVINNYNSLVFVKNLIADLHRLSFKIIFINGTGPFDVVSQVALNEGDVNLEPFYIDKRDEFTRYLNLDTINYNLVPAVFYERRWVKKRSKNIILMSGNSDPYCCSVYLVGLLDEITNEGYTINILVGSAFDQKLVSALEVYTKANGRIKIIKDIDDISTLIQEASVIISADGLTKFELAVTGVPSIFFSMDQNSYDANIEFKKLNYGIHLGLFNTMIKSELMKAVHEAESDNFAEQCRITSEKYFSNMGLQNVCRKIWRGANIT